MNKCTEFNSLAEMLSEGVSLMDPRLQKAYKLFLSSSCLRGALEKIKQQTYVRTDVSEIYDKTKHVTVASNSRWSAILTSTKKASRQAYSASSTTVFDAISYSDDACPEVLVWTISGPVSDLSRLSELRIDLSHMWSPSTGGPMLLEGSKNAISFTSRTDKDIFLTIQSSDQAHYIIEFDTDDLTAKAATYNGEEALLHMLLSDALKSMVECSDFGVVNHQYFDGVLNLIDEELIRKKIAPELHYKYTQIIGKYAPKRAEKHLEVLSKSGNLAIQKAVAPHLDSYHG